MEIRQGRPEDYPRLLEQVVQSFREKNPAHPRFENMFPDVIGSDAETMSHWRLAFVDGKLAGGIEIIPETLRMGDAVIPVGGIGNVHCWQPFRISGCFTALIDRCVEDMKALGYHISLLGGDRTRYGNHGWENAGTQRSVTLSANIARHNSARPAPCHSCDFRDYTGNEEDAKRMWDVYQQKSCYAIRTFDFFKRVLKRPGLVTYISEATPEEFAYVSVKPGNSIVEYAGHIEGIRRILSFLLNNGNWNVNLPAPEFCGPVEQMFMDTANYYCVQNVGMIRIISLKGILQDFSTLLSTRLAAWNGSFTLATDDGEAVAITAQNGAITIEDAAPENADITLPRRDLTLLLFGPFFPTTLGEKMENAFLRLAFPLPSFWFPLDHI